MIPSFDGASPFVIERVDEQAGMAFAGLQALPFMILFLLTCLALEQDEA